MAATPIFVTGFEHGLLSTLGGGLITGTGGTAPTIISAAARSGGYGLRVSNPGASTTSYAYFDTASLTTKAVVRFAIKASIRPASGTVNIGWVYPTGVGNAVGLSLHSDGTLGIYLYAAGTNETTGVAIDTTNWHVIELQIDGSTTTWTCDWKVDGIAQPKWSLAGMTIVTNWYELGWGAGIAGVAYTVDYDDVIAGSWTTAATDWFGDGQVLAQIAGRDGTHSTVADFSPGDAGSLYSGTITNAYTQVNKAAPWSITRSTTVSLGMRVANTTAYMETGPTAIVRSGVANAVRALLSYSSSTTSANAAGCVVRNSAGTVTAIWGTVGGTLASYAVTSNNFKGALVTKPTAGWTAAEVNAIRWRFGGGTSSIISPVPTAQALMLEVDWRSPTRLTLLGAG